MKWPYPAENQPSWFAAMESYFQAADASMYAARENINFIMTGGGNVSFDGGSGLLEWTSPIELFSPFTGFNLVVPAGEVSLGDGDILLAEVARAPTDNVAIPVSVTRKSPIDEASLVLAVRRGSYVYWRNGALLESGATLSPLAGDGITGGGGADLADAAPPAIGNSGDVGDSSQAARENHTHALGGTVTGDLSGTLPSPTVTKIQGRAVAATAPTAGQALTWNGTAWAPADVDDGSGPAGGDLSGTLPNPTVIRIQGQPIAPALPVAGQVLKFDGTAWTPSEDIAGGGGGGGIVSITPFTEDVDGEGFTISDVGAILPRIGGVPFATTMILDVSRFNDFALGPLTANAAIAFTNQVTGSQGKIVGRQDGTGGRSITGVSPGGGRTLKLQGSLSIPTTPGATFEFYYCFESDYLLFVGIPSGSSGGGAPLASTSPPAVGSASPGGLSTAARGDHSHALGGSVAGDLSGSLPNPTVARLQGRSVSSQAPSTGQVLKWDGSSWAPAADLQGSGGGSGSFTASTLTFGTPLNIDFAGVDRYTLTLTANCTITSITNVPLGGCQLVVSHSGGPWTLTWPAAMLRPVGQTLAPLTTGTTVYNLAMVGSQVWGAKSSAFELNTGGSSSGTNANSVWTTLSAISVVNPMDHGAVGNGITNDVTALTNAIAALPAGGGIIYLPSGRSFRKNTALEVLKEHVKFWAPNRQAEIFTPNTSNTVDISAIHSGNDGLGFFGVKLRSDATERGDQPLDSGIVAQPGFAHLEVYGCEITGFRTTGISMLAASEIYIEGNFVHHTWADHIHHTNIPPTGITTLSWCWENWIFNESPSLGDDGIACVTYEPDSSLNGDMEWWNNVHLGSVWGRGYSVIGGEDINIHHNWAIDVAGAGIIIATEPAFDSNTCRNIIIQSNWVTECAHTIGHPGILISGGNTNTDPIDNVDLINNVSADNAGDGYGQEGDFTNVTNTGLSENPANLPPKPTLASVVVKDTSVLKTRDVSFVDVGQRPGLYRIHVRQNPSGSGYQQRFEYVVKGTPTDVTNFVNTRTTAGDYLSEQQTVSGTAYALLLCAAPVTLGAGVSAVTHSELRAGDQVGSTGLSWLWARINSGNY